MCFVFAFSLLSRSLSSAVMVADFLVTPGEWILIGVFVFAWIGIATQMRHKRICEECDRLRDEARARQTGVT